MGLVVTAAGIWLFVKIVVPLLILAAIVWAVYHFSHTRTPEFTSAEPSELDYPRRNVGTHQPDVDETTDLHDHL